ncbi:MAG: hypothetical protein ACRDKS_17390, partial [Actinomycetota bacterium]
THPCPAHIPGSRGREDPAGTAVAGRESSAPSYRLAVRRGNLYVPMKRLTFELDERDYAYLRIRAEGEDRTVVSLLKEAIDTLRRSSVVDASADPMYRVGSFEGPAGLSELHDEYLLGAR